MISRRGFCIAGATQSLLAATAARAEPLSRPTGKPVLTISGRIGTTNIGDTAVLDRPMLEELGMTSFRTKTPWYTDPVIFEGVPMDVLMRRIQANGETAMVTALNDYASDIPVADFALYHPILALKRNGEYLEVRDKGPFFIVDPYDSVPELPSQKFYSRSPWQVARIEIR
jgi:hypothetical protein